jgi:hypothetical protein
MLTIRRRNRGTREVTEVTLNVAISELSEFSGETFDFINDKAAEWYFKIVKPQTSKFDYFI